MNRESFLDTIKQQYVNDIREAYFKSEHGYSANRVNILELNGRLGKLQAYAKLQGLSAAEFEELARAALPDVADRIHLSAKQAKATKRKKAA